VSGGGAERGRDRAAGATGGGGDGAAGGDAVQADGGRAGATGSESNALPPVADLVPHEPPMLAVEELLACEAGRARARLRVPDRLFARDGRVEAVVALEYMAQVVAACLGHEAAREGEGTRVGMVVACRRMTIERPVLVVGEELTVDVRRVRGTENLSHFDGETRDADGAVVARVTMTLVHGERPPE